MPSDAKKKRDLAKKQAAKSKTSGKPKGEGNGDGPGDTVQTNGVKTNGTNGTTELTPDGKNSQLNILTKLQYGNLPNCIYLYVHT